MKRDPWNPYALSRSVLRAWFNADDRAIALLTTDDGAGLISSIKDRIHLVNPTAATTARPTWSATGFTGADGVPRAGMTLDGVANAMTTTSILDLPTGAAAGELFLVAHFSSPPSSNGILFGYGQTSTPNSLRRLGAGSSTLLKADDGTVGISVPWTPGGHILHGWWSGTTVGGSLDGSDIAPATIPALNTATARLRLGANVGGTVGSFGSGVFRHGIVTTLLTASQRQQMQGFLAWDSGLQSLLPSTHPYRAIHP